MIKKIFAIVLCTMFALCAAVPAFAGQDDAAFQNVTVDLFMQLDAVDEGSAFQMRGFTVSPDGKYAYGGFLQGYRHVTKFDTTSGERIAEYVPEVENEEYDGVIADNNYPKGLAVDCRGYLFVGITHDQPNTSYISLACVNTTPDEDGYMQEVSVITENLNTTRVGINGVASQKIGDKILVYVATCYNKDTLRCYDVTDVNNIHLYTDFGVDGVVDYNELTGSQKDPGYITVDIDGYLYLCYLDANSSYSKGSRVIKIEKDGKSIIGEAEIAQAYGICNAGDYVFVSTHDGANSKIYVLNKSDLSTVTSFGIEDLPYDLSGCYFANNYLWIGAHGEAGVPGEIYRTSALNITRDPKETETVETTPVDKPESTEAPATEDPSEGPKDSYVLFDFSNYDVVSSIKSTNACSIEYDEDLQCMKVIVDGDNSDPYFNLPMSKANYFDGDKYVILTLRYQTESNCEGEIFFTTKESHNIGENHIMFEIEEASEWTDIEIDMRDDDNGNWIGLVRTLRIDPNHTGEDGEVFYFKSLSVSVAEEEVETDPPTTEPKETKAPETEPKQDEPKETKENKPADTKKVDPKPVDNNKGFPVWAIILIVVGVLAIAAVVFILLKKKKK